MDERSRSRFVSRRLAALLVLAGLTAGQAGCSLFVMAGKMIMGDPVQTANFTRVTRIDLVKEERQVVVVCSTPESVKATLPSLEFDMLEEIARQLRSHNIRIIRPDDVATWMDNHGGSTIDPQKVADNFDVDVVVQVDLREFTFGEEKSPSFFRGRARGNISAYEVVKEKDDSKRVQQIYLSEYKTVYPELSPVSSTQMSEKTFQKRFADQVSTQIAMLFYDHDAGDEME